MPSPKAAARPSAPPLHVLVVDSAVVRQAISLVLCAAGMRVKVAADPIIAVAR